MRHNKDNNQYAISKKRLMPEEYDAYLRMGTPNASQNWLEVFTPAIVTDLFTIMNSCSNNQQKAEYIREEMSYYGFEERGLGTNIYVMSNPAYPGVVFKFALDDNGLADNFNDEILQDRIPRYTRTFMRHPSGIVSVQERKVPIVTKERMESFRGDILRTLDKLSQEYLIIDLSPNMFLNYCVERDGSWGFLDASDLYPLEYMKDSIRCKKAVGWDEKRRQTKRCGGRLKYAPDYSRVYCTKCGSEFIPSEIRPNDKEDTAKMANVMMDGFSFDDREAMRQEEMNAIRRKHQKDEKPAEQTPVRRSGFISRTTPAVTVHPPVQDSTGSHNTVVELDDTVHVGDTLEKIPGGESVHYEQETTVIIHEHESVTQEPDRSVDESPAEDVTDPKPEWGKTHGPTIIRVGGATADMIRRPYIREPEPEVAQATSFHASQEISEDVKLFEEDSDNADTSPEDSDHEPAELVCRFVGDDDNMLPGLNIHFKGDPEEAWENDGFGIYVTIEGDTTQRLAISSTSMYRIMQELIADARADMEERER